MQNDTNTAVVTASSENRPGRGCVLSNRFLLESVLSSNSRSAVWRAKDLASKRSFALKLFTCEREIDPVIVQLLREEFASRSVKHPGILLPLHFDVSDTVPYLVLPYMGIGSWRDQFTRMKTARVFDEIRLLTFMRTVAGAVAHLHKNTFVHQDLCPENILFAASDSCCVTDFGINRIIHTTLGHATGPGLILHPAYASPERYQGEAANFPDDVFALGAVMYEVASGAPPWGELGGKALLDGSAGLPLLGEPWSEACEAMIRSCLDRYPQNRPTAQALETWSGRYTPPAAPPRGGGKVQHSTSATANVETKEARQQRVSQESMPAAEKAPDGSREESGAADTETCTAPSEDAVPLHVRIPLSLLVAEDNIVSAEMIRRLLQRLGYNPDVVSSGVEVLSTAESERYDLVFMDIQMPKMDGCQAARIISSKHHGEAGPVIVAMSANTSKSEQDAYKRAGMQDCLPKPMTLDALRRMIEKWGPRALLNRRQVVSDVAHEIIDMRKIRELQELDEGGRSSFVRDMIMFFLRDATELVMQLQFSLDRRYGADIAFHAHKLRGSCLNLGLNALADLCSSIEQDAKRSDLHSAKKKKAQLSEVFDKTVEELRLLAQTLPG